MLATTNRSCPTRCLALGALLPARHRQTCHLAHPLIFLQPDRHMLSFFPQPACHGLPPEPAQLPNSDRQMPNLQHTGNQGPSQTPRSAKMPDHPPADRQMTARPLNNTPTTQPVRRPVRNCRQIRRPDLPNTRPVNCLTRPPTDPPLPDHSAARPTNSPTRPILTRQMPNLPNALPTSCLTHLQTDPPNADPSPAKLPNSQHMTVPPQPATSDRPTIDPPPSDQSTFNPSTDC